MYCLYCRRLTETENITTATSRNGRLMRREQCITCGKKLRHSSSKIMLPVEVFLIPWWTNSLSKCIYQDIALMARELNSMKVGIRMERQSIPINRVDNAAYYHDLCYSKHDDNKTRNAVCDKTMLGELNGIVNPTLRERIDQSIFGKLINAKVNFGLGAPTKAKKILILLMSLQRNSINQSLQNVREWEST